MVPKDFIFTSDEEFEKASIDAAAFYKTIGGVWCPYFGENITFNAKGWKHLKFKRQFFPRNPHDQYARFKLLSLAPKVLKNSHTVQGILAAKVFEEMSVNSRWEKILKEVTYWEFVAVIDDLRICIVVKEIEGHRYFWSVIPFWNSDPDIRRRLLHGNNPEIY
jgi:hypothetical protein